MNIMVSCILLSLTQWNINHLKKKNAAAMVAGMVCVWFLGFLSASHPELTFAAFLKAVITVKCWKVDSQNRQLY